MLLDYASGEAIPYLAIFTECTSEKRPISLFGRWPEARYVLAPTNTLLIRGPATIKLLEGNASILAAPLQLNHGTFVFDQKQLPIEAESETVLEIDLKKSLRPFEIEGSTIPSSWDMAADALLDMREGKVMVIGAPDVGKSTLSVYLTNRLMAHGYRVRVVDADIGQTDLGPPTTIGSAFPNRLITSLTDLTPAITLFIGHTNPTRVESKLIDDVQELSTDIDETMTIVNTDGWVSDPEAVLFKKRLITSLRPDLVLGLAKGNELHPILSSSRAESMNLNAAKQVLARSRSNRRDIRTAGYIKFLEGGRTRIIPIHDLQLLTPNRFPALWGPRSDELNGLIVGLTEENGHLIQIGIFRGVEGDGARVYCRDTMNLRKLEFGYIRLSTSGREIGYFDP
jgi:polynucleotide 5'-hydroxyl-kinase GRC3/NOL9